MEQVRISLGGESVVCGLEQWGIEADRLVSKYGGVPQIERMVAPVAPVAVATVVVQPKPQPTIQIAPQPTPTPSVEVRGETVSVEGAMRSGADLLALEGLGFSPKKPLFTRGTMVLELGVENAKRSRMEHEAKPSTEKACNELILNVCGEKRDDIVYAYDDIRMTSKGDLIHMPSKKILSVTTDALISFLNRLGCGGGQYLIESCWPDLRARNVNNQIVARAKNKDGDGRNVVFRTRDSSVGTREVFGVVSPKYTSFDVDKIAEALALASPRDAKCTIDYDGTKARFEVMFHSDIAPEKYVAGEFFKAGVVINTGDTGGNSIKGSSCVWQNLCLNLIIIDQTTKPVFALRHMGTVEELVVEFKRGFKECLKNLEYFQRAWGYAVEEDIVRQAREFWKAEGNDAQVLKGVFNGIIEKELVPLKKPEIVVPKLMKLWELDRSAAAGFTRAAVVNAVTRYAHEVEQDPWAQDDLQRAAGQLLYGRKGGTPSPLPWVPME